MADDRPTRRAALGLAAGSAVLPGLAFAKALGTPAAPDLASLATRDLLRTHVAVLDQLRSRGIIRSGNNPTGDYAEFLFCAALGWDQAAPSAKGYDAQDAQGTRYQIKARRMTQPTTSRQLSALRDMQDRPFGYLGAVLFTRDYGILRAALIPFDTVFALSTQSTHTNSRRFHLRDAVWDRIEVRDVTARLRQAAQQNGT